MRGTFKCSASAMMELQPVMDLAYNLRRTQDLLLELSRQKISYAASAENQYLQIKYDLGQLDDALDRAMSSLCQCAELQASTPKEKWQDWVQDDDGHCQKCDACGSGKPIPHSRIVDGKKVWTRSTHE
jgi:hypothetical protein